MIGAHEALIAFGAIKSLFARVRPFVSLERDKNKTQLAEMILEKKCLPLLKPSAIVLEEEKKVPR